MTPERHADALQHLERPGLCLWFSGQLVLPGGVLCMLHNVLIKSIVFKRCMSFSAEGSQLWVQ